METIFYQLFHLSKILDAAQNYNPTEKDFYIDVLKEHYLYLKKYVSEDEMNTDLTQILELAGGKTSHENNPLTFSEIIEGLKNINDVDSCILAIRSSMIYFLFHYRYLFEAIIVESDISLSDITEIIEANNKDWTYSIQNVAFLLLYLVSYLEGKVERKQIEELLTESVAFINKNFSQALSQVGDIGDIEELLHDWSYEELVDNIVAWLWSIKESSVYSEEYMFNKTNELIALIQEKGKSILQ